MGALLAALVAFLLAGAVARPVRRVADASRQLAAGERPEPLPVTGSDEVKALATAFNQMAEELDRARDAERAFLLSVSHELKTPLSAIRGHGEALLDGVIEPDKVGRGRRRRVGAARAARARPARPGAAQPARLRRHARAPSTWPSSPRRRPSRHEAEARRVGVSLGADVNGAAPATADPDRVLQVLANLIENAVRSTPAGGSVTVTARAGRGARRRHRPRASRPTTSSTPSTASTSTTATRRTRRSAPGLGLAIVKQLTEAMGGSVTAESEVGRGTTFTVRLPG